MPEESRFKIFSSGRVFFNLPQRAGARACGTGWATDIEKQGEEKNDYSPLIHTFSIISPCFFIYKMAQCPEGRVVCMRGIYPKGAARRKSNRYMNWDEVPLIMGIQELSQLTGYNQNTLKLYCAKGMLPAYKLGKEWRINKEDYMNWAEQQKVKPMSS